MLTSIRRIVSCGIGCCRSSIGWFLIELWSGWVCDLSKSWLTGFGVDSPGTSQRGVALGWMEQVDINAAPEEAEVLNTEGLKLLDDLSGGSEGAAGAVMGAAEESADEGFE